MRVNRRKTNYDGIINVIFGVVGVLLVLVVMWYVFGFMWGVVQAGWIRGMKCLLFMCF